MQASFDSQALQVLEDAKKILALSRDHFPEPIDAMLAHLVAAVVVGKAIGVSLEDLVEGVTLTYRDLRSGAQVVKGGTDVH